MKRADGPEGLRVLKVSSHLFRSPQPEPPDLLALQGRGLKSLINLRAEADESRFYSRQLSLTYLHLPVKDWDVPTDAQMEQFLAFITNPDNLPTLIHCLAGVGRTGLFVTAYRISKGMDPELAISISDQETPEQGMSQLQRDWLLAFAAKRR